jgi:hypothetical protein
VKDFTKDELEDILNWADVYIEFGTSWTFEDNKPLIDKIQSMIDNYCEHDLYETSALVNTCCKCGKCDMVSL